MPIELYYSRFSGPSRAVHMTARHLNIEIDIKAMDLSEGEHLKPDFIQLNPAHTVPTINDNGFVLWESRAIMQYLCNRYAPDSQLYPRDPKKRALVDRWLNYDMNLSNTLGEFFFTKVFLGVDPPQDKVDAVNNIIKIIDTVIGDNKYLTGDELTIADLSLLAGTIYIEWAQYDLSEYPNYQRWYSYLKTDLAYFAEINEFSEEEKHQMVDKVRAKFAAKAQHVPSRAAQMVARHLNIDINFKEVDLATKQQLNPDFLQLNLVHTVPTINDNGFVLWESRAIMQYLCNQYAPDSQLYPKDPKQRALVDRFLNFDISYSLSQKSVLGVKVFAGVDPPADKGVKVFAGVDPPADKVIAYENNLKLVDTLIGDNPYVTGDVLTIADLSLLASATFIEMADYHINGYPNYKRCRYSGPSRAVLMTARQLNIPVNLKPINLFEGEQMKPEFIKVNPAHTVPTIDDNGFSLWESRAIMQYLCNQYAPDSQLYPRDPKKRALVDRSLILSHQWLSQL
ncbi:unnamed protein product [Oppiella nova]|uniref:Glutathione S-transferase n=1 Tax=Oppiella nova TaxID=334625 RepID=A0A7R9M231_9ACAR|nr:unnamed protein product [Oppiella nova]CAG2169353.1 unnamed protein product [Oppiella nova]